jgi:hypothetical protein
MSVDPSRESLFLDPEPIPAAEWAITSDPKPDGIEPIHSPQSIVCIQVAIKSMALTIKRAIVVRRGKVHIVSQKLSARFMVNVISQLPTA